MTAQHGKLTAKGPFDYELPQSDARSRLAFVGMELAPLGFGASEQQRQTST